MSSRALRKAQREREEQERLEKLQAEDVDKEDEGEDVVVPAIRKSAFAMLDEEGDDDTGEDGGASTDNGDRATKSEQNVQQSIPNPSGKKKRKKKKKSTADQEPAEGEDLDEIDRALKQLSTNGDATQPGTTTAGVDAAVNETNKLLAIDTTHLHAQNEMRRLFGRAALEHEHDEQPPPDPALGGNRRQQRRAQQMGLAQALRGQGGRDGRAGRLSAVALRRNIFIQGKDEWPTATGGGLAMDYEEKRADGTILYRFVHNRSYQDVQAQFESCVESMDPNRLVVLLQHNPYHISTLLQVSEIAKQEGDHATSGDLLERALFSMGRSVHSTFAHAVSEGRARLDFRRAENREFWLASWRYMQNLSMRATWRTVYEWAKLLLSLSPEADPYALWLVLDQYALRARQDLDYLNISRNATFIAVHKDMPNVQLSQALAESRAGNRSKGQQALFTAIGRFPWVVATLMQELNLDPPPSVWGKEPRTGSEKLHAELYATRAKDVWNTPETSALLTEVASAVPHGTPAAAVDVKEITIDEARHVLLSDTPALIALVPRKYTAALQSSSDPLAPLDRYPSYLSARPPNSNAQQIHPRLRSNADNIRELQALHGFITNLFPGSNPPGFNPLQDAMDNIVDTDDPSPSTREMQRRITETGISHDVVRQRIERILELQQALGDAEEAVPHPEGSEDVEPVQGPEQGSRRARVEDAPDEHDEDEAD